MPAGHHAFIDIAVHDGIRERYAHGDALVLCAPDLGEVTWANGAGAALFGFDNVYEFMDEWTSQTSPAHRQLKAAAAAQASAERPERPERPERIVMLRVSAGLRSRLESVTLTNITLDDGSPAILLAGANEPEARSPADAATRIVAGLGDDGTHVAVLDATGAVLAASPGHDALDIAADARAALVGAVATERDRLVKRMIATNRGKMPAAIARLSDDPALHLLFAVETDAADVQPDKNGPGKNGAEHRDQALPPDYVTPRTAVSATNEDGPAQADILPAGPLSDEAVPTPTPAPMINAWSLGPNRSSTMQAASAQKDMPSADEGPVVTPAETEDTSVEASRPAPRPEATPDTFVFSRDGRAARFVWKIDSEGRFSEISPDLAAIVGPNAADVIGRQFADVAQVFGIDPDGAISDLLRRRDTWSGRSVLWPVQGTNLAVPVDLAALPTYTRERAFDGFRGFGIVRVGEASEDPEAIGLSLTDGAALSQDSDVEEEAEPNDTTPESAPAEPTVSDGKNGAPSEVTESGPAAANDDPAHDASSPDEDDPFRGETPALKFSEKPASPADEKIVDLDEHRGRNREPLSTGEQAAFREIGRRLAETFGRRRRRVDTTADDDKGAKDTQATSADVSNNDDILPAGPGLAQDDVPADEEARSAPETQQHDASADMPAAGAADEEPAGPAPSSRPIYDESLINDLPVALIIHQGDTILHINPEFFTLTGHDDTEALRAAGGMASLFADGDPGDEPPALPETLSLVRAGGDEIPVNARLQSILWHDRHALMMSLVPAAHGTAFADADHTAALKVEVEELRSILETATDGVIILGEHGDIRSMNRSASALFDYDEAETRNAPFAKLFAHESQRAVMDYLNGLREHGVASVLNDGREVIGREASGGFIPLFMTIGRLSGSNGYCAVMRDITQWKRTEEDLRAAKYAAEQASAHKSEFLARVSHEIRTPLNAIIGFSDMMAEERFGQIGNPRYLEYARDIGRSGKHVLDIVNDLLDISKIEAGEMEIEFAAVALNEAIAETVSLLQPQANGQRVIIRSSLSSSVPDVVADQRSIKQAAINLLSNAIRFTPAGGQIVVSTAYEANGSVVLRIRDTGIGMSRGDLEQAMKPFRQVDGTSRPREGTGLGLPLTKAMVEANRAQFDIRSAPNEGTLVEITFPSQRVLAD